MGSTGSIGTQTLDVVRANAAEFRVVGLGAGKNCRLLESQAREFLPELIVVQREEDADTLRSHLSDTNIKVASGMSGLIELARLESSDLFVSAIVGMIGIRPVIAAIEAKKDIALANKESLVTAGHLIVPLVKEKKVNLLPVDSEHSAIFQCLQRGRAEDVYKIWLTASGGPFRKKTKEQLRNVKVKDALAHPNWMMGKKITVDSATLVNKGLEVIEAHWLFDVPVDKIDVVLQPSSIVHSMVEFSDGAVIAQMATPDMRIPIQYALTFPKRMSASTQKRLDFCALPSIEFEKPDCETFKGLPMAIEAIRAGGSMPTVFNAANEMAVALFLEDRIGFLDIFEIIGDSMSAHSTVASPSVDEILDIEKETHERIGRKWC